MELATDLRTLNLWLLLYPAPDVAGQWIAHCLETDVVTQGDSPKHATTMALEAVQMTFNDDVTAGLNTFRHRAPPADWDRLWDVIRSGDFVLDANALLDGPSEDLDAIAAQLVLVMQCIDPVVPSTPAWQLPVVWTQTASAGHA